MSPSLNTVKNVINNAQVEVGTNANANTNLIQEKDTAQKTLTEVKKIVENQDKDKDNQVNGTVNKNTDNNNKEQKIVENKSADSNSSNVNSSPSKVKPVISKTKPVPKSNFAYMDLAEKLEFSKELGN